jgi:hypothetical protein
VAGGASPATAVAACAIAGAIVGLRVAAHWVCFRLIIAFRVLFE